MLVEQISSATGAGTDRGGPSLLVTRRKILKTAGLAALGAGLGMGCSGRSARPPDTSVPPGFPRPHPAWLPDPTRRFARVTVSPDREIRTIVGLRPFRPSGFRVETEKLDDKLLVHNYGHGGGGVSLSWGTSHLAVEHALESGQRQCAVIGCGAVGLATARLLQRRGWSVTIYAKDLPPHTTSNVAGGQWSPYMVSDPGMTTETYDRQFVRAARLAHRYLQEMVGDYYGVRWIENYVLSDEPFRDRENDLADLYLEPRELSPDEHPFGTAYARVFTTMLLEPPVYLNALVRDFQIAGGRIVVKEFRDRREIARLGEPVVINCTGLGARDLVGDREMTPVKGQLTFLLPQPEVDYIVLGNDLYMFPRTDGILLGGTHERDVWTLEPNLEAKERILAGHRQLFGWGDRTASKEVVPYRRGGSQRIGSSAQRFKGTSPR